MIRKLVISDGRAEREILLVGTIVVGRDPTCQISELDPLLSRRHAEFVADARGVVVRDLGSRNGIFVNGKKVPEHKLSDDDIVQLGHLHVRYVEDATPQAVDVHVRTHATTALGMEAPTIAPPVKAKSPEPKPAAPPPAAVAPPPPPPPIAYARGSDTTIAPGGRATPAPASPPPPRVTSADTATPQVDDPEATRAVRSRPMEPLGDFLPTPDPDIDSNDVTRAVASAPAGRQTAGRTETATEARVVANGRLVVTEATPSCAQVIGARSETLVGGALADVLTRSLTFVATGDGPPMLSLSLVRSESGGLVTVTFKTGQVVTS